jgi:rRNA-processing protein FCF1
LTAIGPQKLPTESSVWDISERDEAKWSADDGVFERLFSEITELDRQTGKATTKINRQRDAVIAETALKNGLILISNDRNLTAVSRNANISVMTLEEFLQTI